MSAWARASFGAGQWRSVTPRRASRFSMVPKSVVSLPSGKIMRAMVSSPGWLADYRGIASRAAGERLGGRPGRRGRMDDGRRARRRWFRDHRLRCRDRRGGPQRMGPAAPRAFVAVGTGRTFGAPAAARGSPRRPPPCRSRRGARS